VWHDESEKNIAWGLRFDHMNRHGSPRLVSVLDRRPDVTPRYDWIARAGFRVEDCSRVVRALPALQVYGVLTDSTDSGIPAAVVCRTFDELEIVSGDSGDLIAEANSMADFTGDGSAGQSTDTVWHTSKAKNKPVTVKQRYTIASAGPAGARLGENNPFSVLNRSSGGRTRDERCDESQGPRLQSHANVQEATRALMDKTKPKVVVEKGPSDDELIQQAIEMANQERERIQVAGGAAGPELRSYSSAVSDSKDRLAADAATGSRHDNSSNQQTNRSRAPHSVVQVRPPSAHGPGVLRTEQQVFAPPNADSERMMDAMNALGKTQGSSSNAHPGN
jgi:hypothetical protein